MNPFDLVLPRFSQVPIPGARILRARALLTPSQYENLNATPITVVPAIAGCLLRPIGTSTQVNISVAYGGVSNITLIPAGVGAMSLVGTIALVATATGLKTFYTGAAVIGAPAGTSLVGRALQLTANVALAGGSSSGFVFECDYLAIPGFV